MDVLETLVKASYAKDKTALLIRATSGIASHVNQSGSSRGLRVRWGFAAIGRMEDIAEAVGSASDVRLR